MTSVHANSCRGAAMLLAVVVLVASGTIAATGLIITGASREMSLKTDLRVASSRRAAVGLVSAVQGELDARLDGVIAGDRPDLGEATSWVFTEGSAHGVARVVGPGSRLDGDLMLVSEAGKLNINAVPEEMLRRFDTMPEGAVDAVLRGRPFASVREAVAAAEASMSDAWVPLVTVFSSDPPRSIGLALEAGAERFVLRPDGEVPVDLPAFVGESGFNPFTAEDRAADLRALYRQSVDNNVPIGVTGRMLDLVTFSDQARVGLLDINAAPAECLVALPGVTPAMAEEIVDTRSRLGAAERAPLNWPVSAGLLVPDQLQEILPFITTRSLQWSLRVEAGLAVGGDDDASEGELEYPVRYALVIDASGAGSRVIMIRDETNALAVVPPPLRPVVEDSAVNLLAERAAANPRPSVPRPASNRPALSRDPSGSSPSPAASSDPGASQVRRDRTGGAP